MTSLRSRVADAGRSSKAAEDGSHRAQLLGKALMLLGAFAFSSANAVAKRIYALGASEMALFLARSAFVYMLNIVVEYKRNGRTAAMAVASFRVSNRRVLSLMCLRSLSGFAGITLLNLSFQAMALGDTFAVMMGTLTTSTILLARVVLGTSERLTLRTLAGGAIALVGLVFVTRPVAIFGGAGAPPSAAGVLFAMTSGLFFGAFNVLGRVLGRARGDPSRSASPAMLVSNYMLFIGMLAGLIALVASVTAPASPKWAWARLTMPRDGGVFCYIALYCVAILVGQLTLAAALGLIHAGRAAVLGLSEIGFSWLLGVVLLHERINALACAGTAIIFVGCVLAATGKAAAAEAPKAGPPSTSRVARDPGQAALAASGVVEFDESDWVEIVAAPVHQQVDAQEQGEARIPTPLPVAATALANAEAPSTPSAQPSAQLSEPYR